MSAEDMIHFSMISGGLHCPQVPPRLAARWIEAAALADQILQAHHWDCGCQKRQPAGRQNAFIHSDYGDTTQGTALAYYSGMYPHTHTHNALCQRHSSRGRSISFSPPVSFARRAVEG